jgi:hypothetical protein
MTTPAPRTFSRLAVPTSAAAAVTSGTYFRLGGYIDAEESALVPANLTYSSSATTQQAQTLPDTTDRAAAAEAYNTTLNSRGQDLYSQQDGSSFATSSGGRTRNTTRQFELNKISLAYTQQTPLKNGILAKTDGDIIAVADGGAIVDLEKGLAVASQTGDFTVDLPAGAAKVSTFNGIELLAGNSSHPANIALTAFGYIKQAAYGPLDDVRFATSSMKTYGYTREWFYGEKYSEHHGTSTSKFYGDETRVTDGTSDQTFNGFANVKFVGRRHTFNLAGTLTIALAGDFTLHGGAKLDINIGFYMKINAIGEAKICGVIDFKMAHIDFKIVDIDCKFINGIEVKQEKMTLKQTLLRIKDESLKLTGSRIKAASESIAAKFTSADVTA